MHNLANAVLWIYIVLLVIGGMIGFLKGKSQVSLVMSVTFAVLLIVTAIPNLLTPSVARGITDALMAAMLVFFSLRHIKTKKLKPSGMMLIITLAALVLRHVQ
jgi:uncharacterized membrane protein (UPF0136 family)